MISTIQHRVMDITYNLSVSNTSFTSNLHIISAKTKENTNLQRDLNNILTRTASIHYDLSISKANVTSNANIISTMTSEIKKLRATLLQRDKKCNKLHKLYSSLLLTQQDDKDTLVSFHRYMKKRVDHLKGFNPDCNCNGIPTFSYKEIV
mmetsp:Transcript_42577/g.51870  ORF Transcript_42577/g.51870 Transcript_42577/m.51870 type:complete len:150 (-) Transcript_42577:179-628(-)